MKSTRLLLTLLLAFLVPWAANAQETVTIGDGSVSNYYTPIGTYYNYSITEQLYTAEEIGMAGTIESISFYYASSTAKDFPITVYMMHTDAENLATGISLADANVVFEGTYSVTGTGWMTIDLDTPFDYDGTSNLLIGINKDYVYYYSGNTWYHTTTSAVMARYTQSDSAGPYTTSTTPGSTQTNRPNIQMEITPSGSGSTCEKPATLALNGAPEPTSVTLAWSETSGHYNIEYKKASDDEWTVRWQNYEGLGIMLVELDPNTDYQARVQSVCGDGVSGWKTISFSTPCDAYDIPYTYGFEEADPFGCWTVISGNVTRMTSYQNSGSYRLDFRGTTSNMIALPQFTAATNTLRVEFWTRPESTGGSSGKFAIGYMTDITDASTFVAVETYNSTEMTTSYVKKTVDFVNVPENANIAMRQFDCSTNYYWYVDDVTVMEIPSCIEPTNLTVSDVLARYATFGWTENGEATSWQICFDDDETDLITTLQNPTTVGGLLPETTYNVKVRAICGDNDYSAWTENVSFTTEPSCYAPTNLSVTDIATYTATISWTDELNEADTWQICFDDDETDLFTTHVTTNPIGGLNPETTYNVKVRTVCGENDYSAWTENVSFTTAEICPDGMVCIGAGNSSSSYLPAYNYYDYSFTQQIYTAAEIGMPGMISSIEFKNTGAEKTLDCNIYMTTTTKTAFDSSTDWVALSESDLVFSGEITFANGEWTTIELDTPFEYDGTSNLLISVDNVTGEYTSSPHMSCLTFTATNQALYAYRDNTPYDIAAPGVSGTRPAFKNRIRIAIGEPPACPKPSGLTVSDVLARYATFGWNENGEATSWQICFDDDETDLITTLQNPTTVGGLLPETTYNVKVRAVCGENDYSDWTSNVSFTTLVSCPKPTELTVSNVFARYAMISWTENGEANSWQICFDDDETDLITTNATQNTIGGLLPETTYNVKVRAVCGENDYSSWTDNVSFTTLPSCFAPENVTVDDVTAHNATLTWEGDNLSYNIRYQVSNGIVEGFEEGTLPEGWIANLTSTSSGVKTQAAHSGSYGFQFYYNEHNASLISPELSGTENGLNVSFYYKEQTDSYGDEQFYVGYTTDETVIDPADFIYGNIITASLDWQMYQASFPAGTKRIAIKYVYNDALYLFLDDFVLAIPNDEWTEDEASTNSYLITGLDPETTYLAQVQGVCDGEVSSWSQSVRFTTAIACPAPTNLSVMQNSVTAHTAQLSWEGTASVWEICLNGDEDNLIEINENPYLLEDLDPETTYTVKVRANCGDEDGVSTWSNTVEFTTDIACYVPTNLTVNDNSITTESAEITWEPGTGDQDAWQIAISTDPMFDPNLMAETDLINVQESPVYEFTDLTQNTSYYIYVRANCHEEGYSEWTDMASFTTLPTCQIPVGAEVFNLTPNSATLSWTGNASSYILTLGVEDTPFAVNFDDIENIPAEFDNTSDYPWIITEGANGYCMQSGNAGVASSTSSISLNMYYVADGTLEFDAQCMGEGTNWDVCRFYIDGEQMFSKGANGEQWDHYSFIIAEGEHTFTWSYSKDGSVNPTGDHFAVDNIVVGPTNIVWNEPIVTENSYYFFEGLNDGTIYFVMIQGVCGEDYSDVAETYFTTLMSSYTKIIAGYGENTDGGYYLIASPVVTAVPTADNGFLANEYDLYSFNQSAVHEEWHNYKEQSFNLFAGKGYLYANSQDDTLTFTGKTYTGDGVFNLVYDMTAYPTMRGANLVGNPYTETAYIDRDFYVMNEEGNELIAATAGTAIEAMTGLFVIAGQYDETVTFTTEAPAKSSSLNLNLSQNSNVVDRAIVRFDSKRNMPKFQLRENSTKVYIPMEGQDYAVACAGEIGELPVNFKAETNGSYTLNFTAQEVGFSYLHLIDNMTGIETNLLETPYYTFNANTSDYASRFRLVFATGSSVDGDSFGFINGAGNLSIFGIEGTATVQVMDVLGHILSSETFSGSYECKLNVAPGVYMIRLIQGNDVKTQKMVIR